MYLFAVAVGVSAFSIFVNPVNVITFFSLGISLGKNFYRVP
jgi:hypothetical protein